MQQIFIFRIESADTIVLDELDLIEEGLNLRKGAKCSQPLADNSRKEGLPRKNSAEQERYAGVHNPERITENNIINVDGPEEGPLEQIVDKDNLNEAFKRDAMIKVKLFVDN